MTYILAIDQGTTSSRAIVFDADMKHLNSSFRPLVGLNMTLKRFGNLSLRPAAPH
jgi:glycerol kinase